MAAETGTEQWRVELAELLARVEAEGRELTDAEWRKLLVIVPEKEAAELGEHFTATLQVRKATRLFSMTGSCRG